MLTSEIWWGNQRAFPHTWDNPDAKKSEKSDISIRFNVNMDVYICISFKYEYYTDVFRFRIRFLWLSSIRFHIHIKKKVIFSVVKKKKVLGNAVRNYEEHYT